MSDQKRRVLRVDDRTPVGTTATLLWWRGQGSREGSDHQVVVVGARGRGRRFGFAFDGF